jgi:hypothetical protein
VWDGANDENVGKIASSQREIIEQVLANVPTALRTPHALIQLVRMSSLVERRDWNLTFRFSRLSLVGNSVLVAELDPATPNDVEQLQELIRGRSELSARVQPSYGFSPYQKYWPHVSLGYFANDELARLAMPCVKLWNTTFVKALEGQSVTFTRAQVYGINEMATFFICEGK